MQNSLLFPSRNKLIFAGILLAVATLIAGVVFTLERDIPKSSGTALIGGPFTLINQKGETVTEKSLLGHYSLVFFGFTSCPDVCPTELQVMAAALNAMGTTGEKITPVFVSVDPERDTPAVLASYVTNFHPRLQGLTGTPGQVAAMAKAYHVYYKKVPDAKDPQNYQMEHSAIIFVMGPQGEFVTHFTYSTDAKELADSLKKVLHT